MSWFWPQNFQLWCQAPNTCNCSILCAWGTNKLLLWHVKISYFYDRKYHTFQIFFCTLNTMAGHGGFLKFKTRPGWCDMVIMNPPLKRLRQYILKLYSENHKMWHRIQKHSECLLAPELDQCWSSSGISGTQNYFYDL